MTVRDLLRWIRRKVGGAGENGPLAERLTPEAPFRVNVDPVEVERLLDEFMLGTEPALEEARMIARKHHALPVILDTGGGCMLRPSGEAIGFSWEAPEQLEPVWPYTQHIFRAFGARRYPSIEGLAPIRASGDLDCIQCGGTGVVKVGDRTYDNLICQCGGCGWMPAAGSGH